MHFLGGTRRKRKEERERSIFDIFSTPMVRIIVWKVSRLSLAILFFFNLEKKQAIRYVKLTIKLFLTWSELCPDGLD